jgi:hypothetical protein
MQAISFGFKTVASLCLFLVFSAVPLLGQSSPVRFQAQYTQLYSDNVETPAPTVGPAFVLGAAGSITSNLSEVISESYSIKGSYFGTDSFTPYLQSVPANLPLSPNQTYQVTFKYRILTTPSQGFEVLFLSPTAGALGDFLPSYTITGSAGDTGTSTQYLGHRRFHRGD